MRLQIAAMAESSLTPCLGRVQSIDSFAVPPKIEAFPNEYKIVYRSTESTLPLRSCPVFSGTDGPLCQWG